MFLGYTSKPVWCFRSQTGVFFGGHLGHQQLLTIPNKRSQTQNCRKSFLFFGGASFSWCDFKTSGCFGQVSSPEKAVSFFNVLFWSIFRGLFVNATERNAMFHTSPVSSCRALTWWLCPFREKKHVELGSAGEFPKKNQHQIWTKDSHFRRMRRFFPHRHLVR